MDQSETEAAKKALLAKKERLERELSSFADRDENLEGDWDSRYPKRENSNVDLEERADDVEEYSTRLHTEFSLEEQLQRVTKALDRIEEGTYGTCGECGKEIATERLKAYPEAPACMECAS